MLWLINVRELLSLGFAILMYCCLGKCVLLTFNQMARLELKRVTIFISMSLGLKGDDMVLWLRCRYSLLTWLRHPQWNAGFLCVILLGRCDEGRCSFK